jgi:DNA primase
LEDMMELYNKKIDPGKPGIYLIEEEKPFAEIKNTAGAPRVPLTNYKAMTTRLLNRPPGLQWPWRELAKLSEIDVGHITTIIAGTGHGKTSVALNLALHFLKQGKTVSFWSGEMASEILVGKLQGMQAKMGLKAIISELRQQQAGMPVSKKFLDSIPIIEKYCENFHIPEVKANRVADILENVGKVNPDVMLLDYIQQLHPSRRYRTRDEEVESVMDDLNKYSINSKLPIVLFAQINREARNVEKPEIHHVRHSATVEQYSSNVIGVWNSAMAYHKGSSPQVPGGWYWKNDADTTARAIAAAEAEGKSLTELIILKSRYHGNVGKAVPLLFHGPTGILEDFPISTSRVTSRVVSL